MLMLLHRESKEANLLTLECLQAMRLGEILLRGIELQRITIRPSGKHPSRTNHGQPKGFGVPRKKVRQVLVKAVRKLQTFCFKVSFN